jgi:hypothetical protein
MIVDAFDGAAVPAALQQSKAEAVIDQLWMYIRVLAYL